MTSGFESVDIGVGFERDVGVLQRRVHGAHLRVGFGAQQARESVAGLAADTAAGMGSFSLSITPNGV